MNKLTETCYKGRQKDMNGSRGFNGLNGHSVQDTEEVDLHNGHEKLNSTNNTISSKNLFSYSRKRKNNIKSFSNDKGDESDFNTDNESSPRIASSSKPKKQRQHEEFEMIKTESDKLNTSRPTSNGCKESSSFQGANGKSYPAGSMSDLNSSVDTVKNKTNSLLKNSQKTTNLKNNFNSTNANSQKQLQPNKQQKNERFQYGNYNRYYGYRNVNHEPDHRILTMKKEWFENKDVLDIGCNVGFVTLQLARDFSPKSIIGIDIDGSLIGSARKNIRHYLKNDEKKQTSGIPISLPLCHGPTAKSAFRDSDDSSKFPNNVMFLQGNYVPESESELQSQQAEFDAILCLSVSKWVQLNWGDEGVKRMFRRIYRQLRDGGILLLEYQAWSSYGKKKKLTETIFENYKRIQLRPERFTEYLLSSEVGFTSYEIIDVPYNSSKGFRRPILLFRKSLSSTADSAGVSSKK